MKSTLAALAFVALFAGSVQAQMHPQPNLLGLYFEQTASWTIGGSGAFQVIWTYLILSDPTVPSIAGWEAEFGVSGSAAIVGSTIPQGGTNSRTNPVYSVVYPTPLPCSQHTVLMTLGLMPMNNWEMNCIAIFGIDQPALPVNAPIVYLEGGGFMQVPVDTFSGSNSVLQLNGPFPVAGSHWYPCAAVVADAEVNWGTLKGSYR